MKKTSWPLLGFALLIVLFSIGLMLNPRHVPSPFIGQPAPEIKGNLLASTQKFDGLELENKVWLFNVWASWCTGCYVEHPFLLELKQSPDMIIVGLNYKDNTADAQQWLIEHGNPYDFIIEDPEGDIGLNWGIFGVPETFLIDHQGRVHEKWLGALTKERIEQDLLPKWQALQLKQGAQHD